MDNLNEDDGSVYTFAGPRMVSVQVVPTLSDALRDHLSIWEPFAVDALIILQDEAEDKAGKLYIPEIHKQRKQMSIGTGWVIGKCRDANHIAERLRDIRIGDRVKFPAGVSISAEFPSNVPEFQRVHILHLQNLLMITRCGLDNPSDILGYESTEQSQPEATEAALHQSVLESLQREGHIVP